MPHFTRYYPGGEVRRIAQPDDHQRLEVAVRRASHIEPAQLLRRAFFHILRRLFGEDGRVAEWTRHWRCLWRVDLRLSGGPVVGCFLFRENALAFEHDWLVQHWVIGDLVHQNQF